MRIYKFGGASVKDADGVRNLVAVLNETGHENTFLVISAMGKTTNAMEAVVDGYFRDKSSVRTALQEVRDFHHDIVRELFPEKDHPIYSEVNSLFEEISGFLAWNKSPKYNFVYDQVVSYGELLSTTIVNTYLNVSGIPCEFLDVRNYIKTDSNYRDVKVNWERTQELVLKGI